MPQAQTQTDRIEACKRSYYQDGFALFKAFFDQGQIRQIREDARAVFINQMHQVGLTPSKQIDEPQFEAAMYDYFRKDIEGFIYCGKTCQHLLSLHRLAVSELIVDRLKALGLHNPAICTRPVMYFNSIHLAQEEFYYKTPPHQDWISMQGSLNAMVVWLPLVEIGEHLGALQVIPGSHLWGRQESTDVGGFGAVAGTRPEQYISVEAEPGDALFFSAFLIHQSGDNKTDSIRWSCHFRYNDLDESEYIARKYLHPYIYKPQLGLSEADYPGREKLEKIFVCDTSVCREEFD